MILDKYFLEQKNFHKLENTKTCCRAILAVFVPHSVAAVAIRQHSCKIIACQMR